MNHTIPWLEGIGAVAVFCFFLLSGFLMTLLMTGVYADRPGAFFLNRFLRLYPMYWGALITTFLLWATLNPPHEFPHNASSLFLKIVYVSRGTDRIVGSAWAVTNEICCYVLIGLGVTRTRTFAIWALIASIAVTGAMYFSSLKSLTENVFHVAAAFLPFAIGGFLAHQVQRMRPISQLTNLFVLALAMIGIFACMTAESFSFLGEHPKTTVHVLYLCLLPASAAVLALYRIKASPRLRFLDDVIGRFSYPTYLLHEAMNSVAAAVQLPGFIGTLLVTILASAAFLLLIDNPVNRIRSIVRGRGFTGANSENRKSDEPQLVTSANR